jgi:hypothetical protein
MDRHPYHGTPYHNPSKSVEYNRHDRRNARGSVSASGPPPLILGVGPVIGSTAAATKTPADTGAYAAEQ